MPTNVTFNVPIFSPLGILSGRGTVKITSKINAVSHKTLVSIFILEAIN